MNRPSRIPAGILFAALAVSNQIAVRTGAAGEFASPLDRTLSLNLWEGSLFGALGQIKAKTGVETLIHPPDFPREDDSGPLYLVSGQVELRTILEGLAKRYSFRYRVAGPDRVEISRGYNWVGDEPSLRFLDLSGIRLDDSAAPRKLLGEFIKPLSLVPGGYSLVMEKNPLPGNPGALRAVAALPPALADYLEKAAACLAGAAGDFPAAPGAIRAKLPPENWPGLLERPVEVAVTASPRRLLAEIASRTGTAIILCRPAEEGGTAVFPSGRMNLGQITALLAFRLKYRGRIFLAAGVVLFVDAPLEEEVAFDSRSRELFWDGMSVAGFDAREAAVENGGEAALAERLRREVFPSLWRDPATVLTCLANRLVVIAPANAVAAVAERLAELSPGNPRPPG
ncbi:MAG: hypothetical protein LBU64_08145 [Planctomycetota bacterium]|jgi:hypothetical protein|nr:hypothetical protein [Planctomycetota bacterium]